MPTIKQARVYTSQELDAQIYQMKARLAKKTVMDAAYFRLQSKIRKTETKRSQAYLNEHLGR